MLLNNSDSQYSLLVTCSYESSSLSVIPKRHALALLRKETITSVEPRRAHNIALKDEEHTGFVMLFNRRFLRLSVKQTKTISTENVKIFSKSEVGPTKNGAMVCKHSHHAVTQSVKIPNEPIKILT